MEVGFGVLNFSLNDFWAMTFSEFNAAYDGWYKANIPDSEQAKPQQEPLLRHELEEMMAKFPDNEVTNGN